MTEIDLAAIDEQRARIRTTHLRPVDNRPPSSARGLHHGAVLCADVERTIRFYQDVLEFPLTDIFENRDYKGSNHFFFDIGNGNLLAFFDFPGLDLVRARRSSAACTIWRSPLSRRGGNG
jgi:catechol 2,3-dioxygenase-like lactoylglutathione lyase family enzyme